MLNLNKITTITYQLSSICNHTEISPFSPSTSKDTNCKGYPLMVSTEYRLQGSIRTMTWITLWVLTSYFSLINEKIFFVLPSATRLLPH